MNIVEPLSPKRSRVRFLPWVWDESKRAVGVGSDLPLDRARPDTDAAQEFTIDANWALYCDNYLEEFHIPYIHSSSLAELDYGEYATETYDWCNLQLGVQKSALGAFDLPADHPDAGRHIGGFYYWLFPNLMLNFYPWGAR